MFLILSSSKDTYITDKIVDNKFRTTDANVGKAGTLDLFKLHNESTLSGVDNPIEISRLLLKFDYEKINELTSSICDITHPSFNCKLILKDINAGQTAPKNFNLILHPLAQAFDEGGGRDITSFTDLDACNFLTASYSNAADNVWNLSGARKEGLLGSNDIDIVTSGNLGAGVVNLFKTQNFEIGDEDLNMDITNIVSASISGLIPNHGFRIAFSGTEETDTETRFVKRFGSRHLRDKLMQPQIHVSFDDTINDHHEAFFFDLTGSIFLKSYQRGREANLVSGSSLSSVTGQNSLLVTLRTGSFVKQVTASQHTGSTTGEGMTGVYSATFAIPSNDSTVVDFNTKLSEMISRTGSVTFEEYWSDFSTNVGYFTGSLKINRLRNETTFTRKILDVRITNAKKEYNRKDVVKFRVHGLDLAENFSKSSKFPLTKKSLIFNEIYYRVRDSRTNEVVMPFKTNNNGTRLSTDSTGQFFNFRMDNLFVGRSYKFEFLVNDSGEETIVSDDKTIFRLVTDE